MSLANSRCWLGSCARRSRRKLLASIFDKILIITDFFDSFTVCNSEFTLVYSKQSKANTRRGRPRPGPTVRSVGCCCRRIGCQGSKHLSDERLIVDVGEARAWVKSTLKPETVTKKRYWCVLYIYISGRVPAMNTGGVFDLFILLPAKTHASFSHLSRLVSNTNDSFDPPFVTRAEMRLNG